MSEILVDKISGKTSANAVTVTGENGSTQTSLQQGLAKATVNFNGTGTVAIRTSMNVDSVTDNGTGDYTVNFTNNMSDGNYSPAAFAEQIVFHLGHTRTASAYQFRNIAHEASAQDITHGGLSNFGELA